MRENRAEPRRKTFLGCTVFSDGIGAAAIVRNMSAAGIRADLAERMQLSEIVDVKLDRDQVARKAKVVWREDEAVGLHLLEAADSSTTALTSRIQRFVTGRR